MIRKVSFSIIRLNQDESGWAVVEDPRGAIVKLPCEPDSFKLAVKMTKSSARKLADDLNEAYSKKLGRTPAPLGVSA